MTRVMLMRRQGCTPFIPYPRRLGRRVRAVCHVGVYLLSVPDSYRTGRYCCETSKSGCPHCVVPFGTSAEEKGGDWNWLEKKKGEDSRVIPWGCVMKGYVLAPRGELSIVFQVCGQGLVRAQLRFD